MIRGIFAFNSLSKNKLTPTLAIIKSGPELLVKASNYGYHVPTPVTVADLNAEVKEVYVDDIKRLIEVVLRVNLAGITVNRDDALEIIDLDSQS